MPVPVPSVPVLRRGSCLLCGSSEKPLFYFPKDSHRMRQWLELIDKESFLTTRDETYIFNNGRLCKNHFPESAFSNTLRTSLIKFAFPIDLRNPVQHGSTVQTGLPEQFVPSVQTGPPVQPLVQQDSAVDTIDVQPVSPAAQEVNIIERSPKTKKIANLRSQLSKMKKKVLKYEKSFYDELKSRLTAEQYSFVLTQLRLGKQNPKGRRYTPNEKAFALNLYLQSSSTYRILRRHIALPSKSTLLRATAKVAQDDGFCPVLFKALQKKAIEMNDNDKLCTLVFDEMAIKSHLSYNAKLDKVDGYESAETGKEPKLATQALVFMMRGILKNWKQVTSYYFRAHTSPRGWYEDCVLSVIRKVMECGFKVTSIVCDQGPLNQALFKSLGVTVEKPYFTVGEAKIFALYDMPHLIKNVRNNLQKYDVRFTQLKTNIVKTATWKDIRTFYDFDVQKEKYRIAPKLTLRHVTSKGLQNMNVSLATQVFSHSVATGLIWCDYLKLSSTSLNTASFVSKMNKIFDTANSSSLNATTKYKCAVHENSVHVAKWTGWCKWIKTWKFMNEEGKVVRVPCQKGLMLTLNALKGIWTSLKEKKIDFLMTRRLNQDCIENTFSCIRRRGGFQDNPSTLEFRRAIRNVIVHNFVKTSNSTNCEQDSDFNLLELTKKNVETFDIFNDEDDNEGELIIDLKQEEVPVPTIDEVQENVLAYIGGLLAKLSLKRLPCDECRNLLVGPKVLDTHTFLLYFKEFKDCPRGLQWPTNEFHEYMKLLDEDFFTNKALYFKRPNVRKNFCSVLEKREFKAFDNHQHKENMKSFIVHAYVTMMLKHCIRMENEKCWTQNNIKRLKHVKHL